MTSSKEQVSSKGYRYGISSLLATYLLFQSVKKIEYNDKWYFLLEPVSTEKSIPIITLSVALLFPQSTLEAKRLGKVLSEPDEK